MGRPPRTVRGHFLDFPGSICEPCLRKVPGMRGETHVHDELSTLEAEGFLVRMAGRCGECHQNGVVWRAAAPKSPPV